MNYILMSIFIAIYLIGVITGIGIELFNLMF